jgi:hypothetical protein
VITGAGGGSRSHTHHVCSDEAMEERKERPKGIGSKCVCVGRGGGGRFVCGAGEKAHNIEPLNMLNTMVYR